MSKHLPDSVKIVMYDRLDQNLKEIAGEARAAIANLYKKRQTGDITQEEFDRQKRTQDVIIRTIRFVATRGIS